MKNEISQKEKTAAAIEKYQQTVYGIALSRLASKSDADDVFQEVFLLHFYKGMTFNSDEHEKAWLIRTALNVCKRHNNSPWRLRNVPLDEADDIFVFENDEQTALLNGIRSLKPKYSTVIYLYYFENMPISEIAAALKTEAATVRKRLERARKRLKEGLESDYFE